jgi:hypothetical protein
MVKGMVRGRGAGGSAQERQAHTHETQNDDGGEDTRHGIPAGAPKNQGLSAQPRAHHTHRPGTSNAIFFHWLPYLLRSSSTSESSSGVHGFLEMLGSKWFFHLRLQPTVHFFSSSLVVTHNVVQRREVAGDNAHHQRRHSHPCTEEERFGCEARAAARDCASHGAGQCRDRHSAGRVAHRKMGQTKPPTPKTPQKRVNHRVPAARDRRGEATCNTREVSEQNSMGTRTAHGTACPTGRSA